MKVRLLKKYTPHSRQLPKRTEMEVSNQKGREWVEKGIAEEIKGLTKDDKKLDKIMNDEADREAEHEAEMSVAVGKKIDNKSRK